MHVANADRAVVILHLSQLFKFKLSDSKTTRFRGSKMPLSPNQQYW